TVETISFDRLRGLESAPNAEESYERASLSVIIGAEMHEVPTPPLKGEKREEDDAKNFKPKYKAPFISQGGTTLEEPTNNINEESDSEISKNTKIKAANDADEVKKSDSEIQKCKLHPPAIPLPSSSYTTITPPPPSQTCSKMQNSGLDTLPSPNAPVPSSV
ncbi:hypothetical protein CWI37_2577p0010, partial [Hamiltosporidium tvaerminnensis]